MVLGGKPPGRVGRRRVFSLRPKTPARHRRASSRTLHVPPTEVNRCERTQAAPAELTGPRTPSRSAAAACSAHRTMATVAASGSPAKAVPPKAVRGSGARQARAAPRTGRPGAATSRASRDGWPSGGVLGGWSNRRFCAGGRAAVAASRAAAAETPRSGSLRPTATPRRGRAAGAASVSGTTAAPATASRRRLGGRAARERPGARAAQARRRRSASSAPGRATGAKRTVPQQSTTAIRTRSGVEYPTRQVPPRRRSREPAAPQPAAVPAQGAAADAPACPAQARAPRRRRSRPRRPTAPPQAAAPPRPATSCARSPGGARAVPRPSSPGRPRRSRAGRERDAAAIAASAARRLSRRAARCASCSACASTGSATTPAATKELEAFVELTDSVEQHPVLMDCCRALGEAPAGRRAVGGARRRVAVRRARHRGPHRARRLARRPGPAARGDRDARPARRHAATACRTTTCGSGTRSPISTSARAICPAPRAVPADPSRTTPASPTSAERLAALG